MNAGWSFMNWLQYVLSFALVIGLLLVLLWGLRKMQNGASFMRKNTPRLQIIESISMGTRQKIVLVQMDGHEVLLGVTAHQITALTPWPLQTPASAQPTETLTP
jgi:flagellar protein FliO/FliZ